jgi:transposase
LQRWIVTVFSRVGYHKTLVAIANKHARLIWALLVKGEDFDLQRLARMAVAAALCDTSGPACCQIEAV